MKKTPFKFSKRDTYKLIQVVVFGGLMLAMAFYPQVFNIEPDEKNSVPQFQQASWGEEIGMVTKIVDGDTIDVDVNGEIKKLRLIGINTPETVDPRRPVECFGKEASARAREVLTGKKIRLQADPTQQNVDKYGRYLRFVFLEDGTHFNLKMVQEGYAYEYTYDVPYQFQSEFKKAQAFAAAEGLGLWSKDTCGGQK